MANIQETRIYAIHDPMRDYDWRLRRVNQLLRGGRHRPDDDAYSREYNAFRKAISRAEPREKEKAMNSAFFSNPGMVYAHNLYLMRDIKPAAGFVVESRILARMTNEEISKALGTVPETIEWYEKLFFNVRDRLTCHDWILHNILTPALAGVPAAYAEDPGYSNRFAIPYYDSTLKYFSYFGGPVMGEFMIHGARIGVMPHSHDDLLNYMEDEFKHKFFRRAIMASQTFEVNKYNVTELFGTFAGIMALRAATDDVEKAKSGVHQGIFSMLNDLPWGVGDVGAENIVGTLIEGYDTSASELRADELLLLGSGNPDDHIKEIQELTIREPLPKTKPQMVVEESQGSS